MILKILSVIALLASFAHGDERLNIIYILADDLGIGDLGCYGQKKLKTPNLDRLAKQGMLFRNHYSGNTVCSPTRAVLMTGNQPGEVHCRGNGAENNWALDPKMTTMPRMFKNAGYATGAFGKWGLGTTSRDDASNPMKHGFDHFSGWKSQTIAHTYYPTCLVRDGREVPLKEGTFVHDLIMADAFQFVEESIASKKPFFCYIPTAIPHAAMHAPKELHEKWRKVYPQFDKRIGKNGAGPGEKTPNVVNPVAGFAAMMENLDNQVGELLELLREKGVAGNTIVMFSSDNGAHKEGGHDPAFWDSNGPYRGISSPGIVHWPAGLKGKAGTISHTAVHLIDVLPTLAEVAQAKIPAAHPTRELRPVSGTSIAPIFESNPITREAPLHFQFAKDFALREGDWKAVSFKGEEWELYNISTDRSELTNLAEQDPDRLRNMVEKWKQMSRDVLHAPNLANPKITPAQSPRKNREWTVFSDSMKPPPSVPVRRSRNNKKNAPLGIRARKNTTLVREENALMLTFTGDDPGIAFDLRNADQLPSGPYLLSFELITDLEGTGEVYYTTDGATILPKGSRLTFPVKSSPTLQDLVIQIETQKKLHQLRLDVAQGPGAATIRNLRLLASSKEVLVNWTAVKE
ncbi:sulfatase-like hydrolase/transferase [Akkermansiaceae bacterium]|nr:sulfatase-like hydrolase/transferase [Akkermansiaceae bacterium]